MRVWNIGRMMLIMKKWNTGSKTCPSATLTTTNHVYTELLAAAPALNIAVLKLWEWELKISLFAVLQILKVKMFNTLALWMCSAQKEGYWLWHWHTHIHCVSITPKQATVMLKRSIWWTAKLKIFFGNLKNLCQSVISTSLDACSTCEENLKCFRYLRKFLVNTIVQQWSLIHRFPAAHCKHTGSPWQNHETFTTFNTKTSSRHET